MSLFSFFKTIKEGSDDYVRNQLFTCNMYHIKKISEMLLPLISFFLFRFEIRDIKFQE